MTHRFIIAGTGRSGTKWCATALRVAGIRCGHEQVFCTGHLPDMEHFRPRWDRFEGDSSLAAVPFLSSQPDATRVLVVRHPFDTVSSYLHVGPFLEGSQPIGLLHYLERHIPSVLEAASDVEAAMRYWFEWNMRALPHVDEVLRIEELDIPDLLGAVKRDGRWPLYPFHQRVNASQHLRFSKSLLEEVPAKVIESVCDLGGEFGYEVQV